MAYDRDNIFRQDPARRDPVQAVYEDDYALAFHDINPLAPVHVLVIPKGEYVSMADFTAKASAEAIAGFLPRRRRDRAPARVAARRLPLSGQYRRPRSPGGAALPRPHLRRRAARAHAEQGRGALSAARAIPLVGSAGAPIRKYQHDPGSAAAPLQPSEERRAARRRSRRTRHAVGHGVDQIEGSIGHQLLRELERRGERDSRQPQAGRVAPAGG